LDTHALLFVSDRQHCARHAGRFGIADAVTAHSLAPLYDKSSGVIGGILAGAAGCRL
jgi:hypothetical protein